MIAKIFLISFKLAYEMDCAKRMNLYMDFDHWPCEMAYLSWTNVLYMSHVGFVVLCMVGPRGARFELLQ